ncbi:MAG: PIN domain-containing protein [Burkholderiaceae bacterium]|nr:PIN domain-containing protein [Burkholderiaceae bacterium]
MMSTQLASRHAPALPKLVLDTNAVLDWLVFDNPSCQAVTTAIVSGRVSWIVNDAVRDELAHVLGRGVVDRWTPDLSRLWQMWERHSMPGEPTVSTPPLRRPRCTDTDDQKFVDLALDTGAQWLITRDRALLKLARRAHPLNLAIVTPERFNSAGRSVAR